MIVNQLSKFTKRETSSEVMKEAQMHIKKYVLCLRINHTVRLTRTGITMQFQKKKYCAKSCSDTRAPRKNL